MKSVVAGGGAAGPAVPGDESGALEELANSIKEHGIIQPIIVKKSIKGYELVAGERRTRAARLAGFTTIPAIIKEFNDVEMMEIALIENIERENLNPIEEAKAYDNILRINNITQEELAHKFSKSRRNEPSTQSAKIARELERIEALTMK